MITFAAGEAWSKHLSINLSLVPYAWLANVLILTRLLKRGSNWLASLALQHKH